MTDGNGPTGNQIEETQLWQQDRWKAVWVAVWCGAPSGVQVHTHVRETYECKLIICLIWLCTHNTISWFLGMHRILDLPDIRHRIVGRNRISGQNSKFKIEFAHITVYLKYTFVTRLFITFLWHFNWFFSWKNLKLFCPENFSIFKLKSARFYPILAGYAALAGYWIVKMAGYPVNP